MARSTVDITPLSPLARGIGQQGSGAVQYRADPNAGTSAGLLAKSLGVVLNASQQRDRRKIDEANKQFELEFNGYVTKALQDDNTTDVAELDTLFPDMNMPRKLLILEASGKKTIERDETFQSILSGIGSQNTDDDGVTTGTPNTLEGLNTGFAQAESYIRDSYKGSNMAFQSGMLGYLEANRSAQIQQFVSSQRAAQLQDTKNDFQNTDVAIAASGDWEALLVRDQTWDLAGGNGFIQGGDRNAYITDAAYQQAKANRDIKVLSTMPEVYKGSMRGKPQLWQTYLANVQREIDKLNADDVTARLKAADDAKKARQEALRLKMINKETLSENDIREIEADSSLSGTRSRLRDNTSVDPNTSKINTTTFVSQLKNARTSEDLEDLGLSEEKLNDLTKLQEWASTREGVHPTDVPTILAAAQEAYYITDVRNSDEHKKFNTELDAVLADIRDVSVLEGGSSGNNAGITLGILGQDTTFYRRGKEIAENEFSELVAIYREENGNEKLTLRQLREIRELVVAKTQTYVTTVKSQRNAVLAAKKITTFTDELRNTSNQYKDPDTDVIYDVFDRVEANRLRTTRSGGDIRQIGNNRFILVR
jgi:hypothetical protein